MKNNQPLTSDLESGKKANTTQTYSQTNRSARSQTKYARRVLVGCLLIVSLLLALGGGVYILYRTGFININNPFIRPSSSSERDNRGLPNSNGLDFPTVGGLKKPATDGDLTGYTVILDPGHGGRDEGCIFPFDTAYPDYRECDYTLEIANLVSKELTSRGAEVYMLREDDSWISLYNRLATTHMICLELAEEKGILDMSSSHRKKLLEDLQDCIDINEDTVASGGMGIMVGSGVGDELEELFEIEYQLDDVIYIAIHLNSSPSYTYNGTQIFYVTDESVIESEARQKNTNSEYQRSDFPIRDEYYGRQNEQNQLLASLLYDSITGAMPELVTNGDPVSADNYAVLREHGLSGALVEVAFLSDSGDREILNDSKNLKKIARSIADGIEEYFSEIS